MDRINKVVKVLPRIVEGLGSMNLLLCARTKALVADESLRH